MIRRCDVYFWEDGKLLADKDSDRSLVIDGVRGIIACHCQLVHDVTRGGAPGEPMRQWIKRHRIQ